MAKKKTAKQKAYTKYIKSKQWKELRERWWASKLSKDCYVCRGLELPMDLHHRTYERFGHEYLKDLVPVHRKCHKKIHAYHRKHPSLTLWEATKAVRDNHA